ncbi:zinc ribbon domain-containing protein [Butyrivibrio sp. MC2021]|uniref:zinc ribbon domain-containing protein n=1 Tax=Butyrivibrio sp. MC2021 TaxID=1408306 RepID=UPI00047B0150|nr:zinc ribbon domain-containing protein [Butyrivibrio sp. MC2021]
MIENEKKPILTVKNILRVLSLLCIVFVFCPTFLVSCSGDTIDVSAMSAVTGIKSYGETVVDPHPIMLIVLLLPIATMVLLFLKKLKNEQSALIIAVCGVVDFIMWLVFRSSVKDLADENYCEFKSTVWFVFNMIVLFLIVVLSVLAAAKIVDMEADLVKVFTSPEAKKTLNQMSAAVNQMSDSVSKIAENISANTAKNTVKKEDIIGYCSKCGKPLMIDNRFCTSCGAPVPEDMIAEAEVARKAAEEARRAAEEEARKAAAEAAQQEAERNVKIVADTRPLFCTQCGAKLVDAAAFCKSCGAKIE